MGVCRGRLHRGPSGRLRTAWTAAASGGSGPWSANSGKAASLARTSLRRVVLGHEGQEGHGAGQRDQDQASPAPASPSPEVEGGDDQGHVEPAVGDAGPGHDRVVAGEVLQRDADTHQDHQQTADDVRHHAVAEQGTLHGCEPTSRRRCRCPPTLRPRSHRAVPHHRRGVASDCGLDVPVRRPGGATRDLDPTGRVQGDGEQDQRGQTVQGSDGRQLVAEEAELALEHDQQEEADRERRSLGADA